MSALSTHLELRPVDQVHAENMLRWMLDPDVAENIGLRTSPTLERTREWIAKGNADAQAIIHDGRHVGNVVLDQFDTHLATARISIYIGEPCARGHGTASAALQMAIARGFEQHKLHRIWLTVHERNTRAIALYEKLGFRHEGVLREDFLLRGERVNAILMGMLRSEFQTMKAVILQPSYIPWRGYFHQVQKADVFVFYDCVQYDADGWRNRNQIKTANGPLWLTIPVRAKGNTSNGTAIKDVPIDPVKPWRAKHWRTLEQSYAKAPHFKRYADLLREFFDRTDTLLADFTCDLTLAIARELGIAHTQFVRSSTLPSSGTKTDRLIHLLKNLGATHYLSGPSARGYMEEDKLAAAGISLEYMQYDYPEYPQLHGAFLPQLSILDLLFNAGPDAPRYIWAQP